MILEKMIEKVNADKYLRKYIRKLCNTTGKPYPIEVIDGAASPYISGRSYYWTTPSGKTIVRYPSSYRWPKLYHGSTKHIEIGADWLLDVLMFRKYLEKSNDKSSWN